MNHLHSPGRRHFLGRCLSASLLVAASGLVPCSALGQLSAKTSGEEATQQLDFVHVSDMHAAYNPDAAGSSPMARIRGYLEATRRANPHTLFTNSGDDYEKGSLAEQLSHGATTRQVVHSLGYDVRTLGNHDFAWGLDELLRFSHDPRAAVLCANVRMPPGKGSAPAPAAFVTRQIGKLRVGFFGLTTRPYSFDSRQHDGPVFPEHPDLTMNYDHLAIARDIITRYRRQVDLLVLVSHLGITDDHTIARKTEGIDLILGGHSHTVLKEALRVGNTAIVHVGSNGERFGHYRLLYDLKRKAILSTSFQLLDNRSAAAPLAPPPAPDPPADRAIAAILAPYRQILQEEIGEVRERQDQASMALLAARAATTILAVDAALIEPHSVWREWQPGPLTRQDILDAFQVEREPVNTPGTSSLYQVHLSGALLLRVRQQMPDCLYHGPEKLEPGKNYRLAIQKSRLFANPDLFRWPPATPPQAAAELWQVVAWYAVVQRRHGLALDQTSSQDHDLIALATPKKSRNSTL